MKITIGLLLFVLMLTALTILLSAQFGGSGAAGYFMMQSPRTIVLPEGQSATSCVFDGMATAGDYVGLSRMAPGECHDEGSTRPKNVIVIGKLPEAEK
jgi:hypothetical protein